MLIATRKSLEEHGGRVSQDVRGKIENAMSGLEMHLKGDDKDQLEAR